VTTTHALDLFAGAGGWDLAAHDLDIHADGVENMPEARATRDAAGLTTVHDDVWTVPAALLALYVLLICSPPCQTFSAAGKGSGRAALDAVLRLIPHVGNWSRSRLRKVGARATGDDRTALVLAPLWYALNMPNLRSIAWEQVPAVLPVWEACAEVLRSHGWHVWTGIVYAEQYGVPQTRKRAILIASRDHEVGRPTPTHSRYHSRDPQKFDADVLPWVSMAAAIGQDIGVVRTGQNSRINAAGDTRLYERTTEAPAPTITGQARSWIVAAGRTGEGRPRPSAAPAPTVTGKGTAYWLESAEDYRPDLPEWAHERPSTTVCADPRIGRPGTKDWTNGESQFETGAVRVTVHEAGVLQTFPADYPWQGNSGKRYLQAGNAVPRLMARAILHEATVGASVALRPVVPRLANLFDLLDARAS
jgi:DNA (cytosine-5)-methyltransferase 1